MSREALDKFLNLITANLEQQEKAKSLDGDADALSAYAGELGCDISPQEFREYQDKARELLESKMKRKLAQPDISLSPGAKEFYAFMKLADTNDEMALRLVELANSTPEELIAFGAEKGFAFDKQDMLAVGKDILEPSDELSEEELELVAGGLVDIGLALVFVGCVLGLAAVGGVAVAGGAAAGGAAVGFVLALMKK